MLRKLLKHEFRATGRILWPMYAALLVLAVFANLSVRLLDTQDYWLLNMIGGLLLMLFVLGCIAACVMTFVLVIQRFRSNLMGDEGYVMFTLPASVHAHLWSKLITAFVWFAATTAAVLLSVLIVTFRVDYAMQFFKGLGQLFQYITAYYAINGVAFVIELIVLMFLSCAGTCLLFYAAIAIGHSFASHKTLLSVAFFFGIVVVMEMLSMSGMFGIFTWLDGNPFVSWNMDAMQAIHLAMGASIGIALVYDAVFYAVTIMMLKKRLNLE